jgi:tripartite ATP-independent transporter DctM subunit
MANTAMLGSLMVPEMARRGYAPRLAMGPILGTGGLAILIPPSTLAVLLASLARIDVGALLVAGLVPGLLLAVLYMLTIRLQLRYDPGAAPRDPDRPPVPLRRKLRALLCDVAPTGIVVFCVVGLIILGVATPSEAAAFGALSVFALALAFRALTIEAVIAASRDAVRITGMAFLILIGSSTFSQLLAFSGATSGLVGWAAGLELPPLAMLAGMVLVLLALGMFMDQLSMMLLTLPVFMPLAHALGFDPVWFGVIVLLTLEIGLITPPFGLLLFVMAGAAPAGTTAIEVARSAVPYIGCALLLLVLIVVFPPIALFVPALVR